MLVLSDEPVGVVTITTCLPSVIPELVVMVTVSCVPPAFEMKLETFILVSTLPLISIKAIDVAVAKFIPLKVTVAVVPIVIVEGVIAEMYGPVTTDMIEVRVAPGSPNNKPLWIETKELRVGPGLPNNKPLRTDTLAACAEK